jgi:hypothetical protein
VWFRKSQIWRKRVGVEPKHSTPNSRRMMTLQLPPSSNWSQLEPERFTFPQNFASSTAEQLSLLHQIRTSAIRLFDPRFMQAYSSRSNSSFA